MTWRAVLQTQFQARTLDDELVVYHIPSGDTHLLGEDAAKLFAILRETPQDAHTLACIFSDDATAQPDTSLISQIENLLADLHSLELIEVSPS